MVTELNGFLPGTDCFFLNPITSQLLYRLYRTFPHIPWYGLLLYVTVYWGYALILSAFIRRNSGFALLLAAPFLFIIFFHCFVFVSFTSASLLLLFGVFLCLLDWALTKRCPTTYERLYSLLLTLALIISYSLRWRLVLYSSILILPVILYTDRTLFRKTRLFWAGFSLLIMLSGYFMFAEPSGNDHFFVQYNKVRSMFHDTDKGEYYGEITRHAIATAGWDATDFVLFRNYWFLHDQTRFNVDTVKTFLKANNPIGKISFFKQVVNRTYFHFQGNKTISLILACTLLSLFIYGFDSLVHKTATEAAKLSIALGIVMTIALFLLYYRFVPRVYLPLFTYMAGTIFLMLSPPRRPNALGPATKLRRTATLSFLILLTLIMIGMTWTKTESLVHHLFARNAEKENLRQALSKIEENRRQSERLLLIPLDPNNNLLQETIFPLKEVSDFTTIPLLPAGWQIHSRRYFRILHHFGLHNGRELLAWTIDNPNVLWFQYVETPQRTSIAELVETYFQQHMTPDGKPDMKIVYDFRNRNGIGLVCYEMITKG